MTDDMLNPLSIISENLMTLSSTASEKSGERNEQKKKKNRPYFANGSNFLTKVIKRTTSLIIRLP